MRARGRVIGLSVWIFVCLWLCLSVAQKWRIWAKETMTWALLTTCGSEMEISYLLCTSCSRAMIEELRKAMFSLSWKWFLTLATVSENDHYHSFSEAIVWLDMVQWTLSLAYSFLARYRQLVWKISHFKRTGCVIFRSLVLILNNTAHL